MNYDLFYLHKLQAMSQSSLLSKRVLDESSSDDDDDFIISAAQIVQSASLLQKKQGGSVPGRTYIYRNREEGHAIDYIKIILMKTPHTTQAYFDGGYIVFIF